MVVIDLVDVDEHFVA
jgi:hypothetical protein